MSRPVHRLGLLPALMLMCLAACGGGGGGGSPAQDLGILASTVPSTVDVVFLNPLAESATVTEASASGPFAIQPADLPGSVAPSESLTLGIVFTPDGTNTVTGTVTVRFQGATTSREVTRRFQATGERVAWGIDPASLDFGTVEPGSSVDRIVTLTNESVLSPVTITGVNVPNAAFAIVGDPFPLTIGALDASALTLRFTPPYGGSYVGTLVVGPFDPGASIAVPIDAHAPGGGGEQIVDFGSQLYGGGGLTSELSVDIPSDAVSFMIEAKGGGSQLIGLGSLITPSGVELESTNTDGPYLWIPGQEVFTAQVPNTDKPSLGIEPGTWRFRLKRLSRNGALAVRVIIERRPGGLAPNGVLPLNVWLAAGISPTAATAAGNVRLQQILTRIGNTLRPQGIELGDIDYYDVEDTSFDFIAEGEISRVLRSTDAATETRVNIFFVNEVIGGGVVGVAGMVGGPNCNGTGNSGVLSVFDGFSVTTVALVAAHEIGHYLGLEHNTDEDGTPDGIDDTPTCPGGEGCETPGGGNLMYWQAIGGTILTDGQGLVIRGHPVLRPGPSDPFGAASSQPAVSPLFVRGPDLDDLWRLPPAWCGTCRHGRPPLSR